MSSDAPAAAGLAGRRGHGNPLESLGGRLLCAALVFVVALAVYLATLAPTVTFVDAGELIIAARYLGVAHPPGTPLYLLLAHLFTLLPVGNVAWRVNFASALFAALASAMTALLLTELLRTADDASAAGLPDGGRARPRIRKRAGRRPPARQTFDEAPGRAARLLSAFVPAAVAGLLLAFSQTFWSFATVAEVYTLNTLLVAAVLFLMFRWRRTREARTLYLAARGRYAEAVRAYQQALTLAPDSAQIRRALADSESALREMR